MKYLIEVEVDGHKIEEDFTRKDPYDDRTEYHGPCQKNKKIGDDRFVYIIKKNGEEYWFCRKHGAGACKKCIGHGNSVNYLMEFKNKTEEEAEKLLEIDAKSLRVKPIKNYFEYKEEVHPNENWQTVMTDLATIFTENLLKSPECREYAKMRGFETDESIMRAKIGWNDEEFFLDPQDFGLEGKKIYFPKGLTIPTYRDGKVVAMNIRRTEWAHDEKFQERYRKIRSDAGQDYYLVCGDEKSEVAILVEAEIDALLIEQFYPDVTCVATSGTAKPMSRQLFNLLNKKHLILISMDNDESGFARAKQLKEIFKNSEIYYTPNGYKDIGDFLKSGGNVGAWVEDGIEQYAPELFNQKPKEEEIKKQDEETIEEPLLEEQPTVKEEKKERKLIVFDNGQEQIDDEWHRIVAKVNEKFPKLPDLKYDKPLFEKFISENQKIYNQYKNFLNYKTFPVYYTSHKIGRLFTRDPNILMLNKKLRSTVFSDFDRVFLDFDYRSIHPKIFANASKDDNLIEIFNKDKDLYSYLFLEYQKDSGDENYFFCEVSDITVDQRDFMKEKFNIWSNRDNSKPCLDQELKPYLDYFNEKFPSFNQWKNNLIQFAKKNGYIEDLLKNKIETDKPNNAVSDFAQRTEVEIVLTAICNIQEKFEKENLKSRLRIIIFDGILFDCLPNELKKTVKIVREEMCSSFNSFLPEIHQYVWETILRIKYGKTWGDLIDYEEPDDPTPVLHVLPQEDEIDMDKIRDVDWDFT